MLGSAKNDAVTASTEVGDRNPADPCRSERSFEPHHAAEVILRLARRRRVAKLREAAQSYGQDEGEEDDGARRRLQEKIHLEGAGRKPGDVAAAVIVGRALAGRRAPIRDLLSAAPVIRIAVRDQETAAAVAGLLRRAFYDRPDNRRGICTLPATDDGRRSSNGAEHRIREALTGCVPIVAATAGPEDELPDFFDGLVDHDLVGPAFTPEDVAFVVRKVVGAAPGRLPDPDVARRARPQDLANAVHPKRGADGSLALVEKLVRRKAAPASGPKLSELVGYGTAKALGLAIARDIGDARLDLIPMGSISPGIVLHGKPGTGKTLYARALAAEAGVPFFAGSLAEWQARGEGHLGTALKAMRLFFQTARDNAPCIALIDEIDGFGSRDRFGTYYEQYWVQLVNGLLELLDGSVSRPGVVVIGATNHVERIDPAIRRAGRFDRTIGIDLPNTRDLEGILRHHLGDDLRTIDLVEIAREARGSSAADAAAMVRRARSRARHEVRPLSVDDLRHELWDDVETIDPAIERTVAVHECGHALVAIALGLQVRRIALGSRSRLSLGSIEHDAFTGAVTVAACRKVLRAAMGGRAAEAVVFGEPSAGANDDLAKATDLARSMVFEWGLAGTLATRNPNLEDPRIEHELRTAFEDASALIAKCRGTLNALVRALIEKRRLNWHDIAAIVAGPGNGSPETQPDPDAPHPA